jgi:metal-responsive CopG/Arc/MetJ family transcriptional regulator
MTTGKTAISLDQELLKETDTIAKQTNNSRSGVIALALKEYFHRLKQEEILSQLNDVYDHQVEDETKFIDASKSYFTQKILESEEW